VTTAIIHGDPGSYKTSSLVSDYLVEAVKAGRVVVTNIRGVKTIEEIADIYKFEINPAAEIINIPFTEAGFEQMARFFHWAPMGAVILMDEGQRVYPTRLKDFKQFDNNKESDRPKTVEDAFDSHRHMNWDIYISTPNIGKIHKEIRAVAEFGFRHKNLATVFAFLQGRYKRVTHNAENSGITISNAIATSLKKIDKRCFDVYQSTATGQTKDSTASVSLFKQPRIILLLLVVAYSVWNMGSNIIDSGGVPALLGGSAQIAVAPASTKGNSVLVKASGSVPAGDVSGRLVHQNPFLGLTVYFVGEYNRQLQFEVQYPDKSFVTVSQHELEQIGFVVNKVSSNFIKLVFDTDVLYAISKPRQFVDVQAVQVPVDFNPIN
jgi:zona occludens toxin